ncbi:hypothetical protein ZEAMMB73_Zm00001d036988 [Zea mays]|uniref:Uncharacterized protein n=1 Tax=Zea mays TaxID=4577 RepID=A0A1D6LT49_MAIZE|nr:hypothetical protein ZEAMMB73_Zm00001d036988 [Zea mays]
MESSTGVCRARRTSGVATSALVASPTSLRGHLPGQVHLRRGGLGLGRQTCRPPRACARPGPPGGLGLGQSVAGPAAGLHEYVPTLRMTTTEKTERTTAPHHFPPRTSPTPARCSTGRRSSSQL